MTAFDVLNIAMFGILTVTAAVIARLRGLYEATMLMALFSLVTASLFVLLDAVDVAFTEAAVGVGVSTVLFLTVLALTRGREMQTPRHDRRWPARVTVLAVGGLLVYASQDLPEFGSAETPVQRHPLTQTYLVESQSEIGTPNTVTAVLASYRGYDTLGELVVIFAAGIAVMMLLGRPKNAVRLRETEPALADYRVLRVISRMLMPFILLFAFYVLFHGDYGPGGGFQAGVIFASGIVLYGLVFGVAAAKRVLPSSALQTAIPLGVLLFGGVGAVGMVAGSGFLDYSALRPEHPEQGQHLGILLVEVGVGVTVAAVMCAVFFAFVGRGASR